MIFSTVFNIISGTVSDDKGSFCPVVTVAYHKGSGVFFMKYVTQWKPLIMITLGPALFGNNNRLITLSGGYNNLHYLTQFIFTTFYMYKKQNLFKKLM